VLISVKRLNSTWTDNMNPKALFVILMIVLIIYLGMSQRQAVCNPPYILHGTECCIDANQDALCDKDQSGAFITTLSETTTTLDPCISLAGYNKTACLFEKEKRRYSQDCAEQCDNVSTICRSSCEEKELPKEKIACADLCFKEYEVCYSGCGVIEQQGPAVRHSGPGETEPDREIQNLTTVF
jgi:hypothetical protein